MKLGIVGHAAEKFTPESAPFVMERFEEHTAKTVQVAKAEVIAFVDGVARDTGLAALKAGLTVNELGLLAERIPTEE